MAAHGVDAVMLIGASHNAQALGFLRARRIPLLLTWSCRPRATVPAAAEGRAPCIGFDNFAAARQATLYLLDQGHRRLGVIAGTTVNNDRSAARVSAVAAALAERGLPAPLIETTPASYLVSEGKAALHRLLRGKGPYRADGGDVHERHPGLWRAAWRRRSWDSMSRAICRSRASTTSISPPRSARR